MLDEVSLQVPSGCVFALLGENGAGKSTLIRGLLGYHKFDTGTVRIAGLDPQRETMAVRRRVGYVSDAPGLLRMDGLFKKPAGMRLAFIPMASCSVTHKSAQIFR